MKERLEQFMLKLSDLEQKWNSFNKKKLLLIVPILMLLILIVFLLKPKPITYNYDLIVQDLIIAAEDNCQNKQTIIKVVFGIMVENGFDYNNPIPESGKLFISEDCSIAVALYDDGLCAKKHFLDSAITITKTNREECIFLATIFEDKQIYEKIEQGFIPISKLEDLNAIRSEELHNFASETAFATETNGGLNKKYVLLNDLDFDNHFWLPIGKVLDSDEEQAFTGIFDGNNYRLLNFNIVWRSNPNEYPNFDEKYIKVFKNLGLFAIIENAEIKNIVFENISLRGLEYLGAVAGAGYQSKIENIKVSGRIIGEFRLGGLVGYAEDMTFEQSASSVIIEGQGLVGGFVGEGKKVSFLNCYSDGQLKANFNGGGFVSSLSKGEFTNSYSVVSTTTDYYSPFAFGNDNQYVNSYHLIYDTSIIPSSLAKTKIELMKKETFQNWDFDNIWRIDEDKEFPRLR